MQKSFKKLKVCFLVFFFILGLGDVSKTYGLSVSGKVEVEKNKSLRNLVIYLSPTKRNQVKKSIKKHKVSQKGRHFSPRLLVVFRGDLVQWLNDEDKEIDHNIYSLSSVANFDLGLGEKGSVLKHDFKKTGTFNYFCSVHKTMEGKLVVLPSRSFTILKKPGSFVLPNVPPGKWELNAVVFHRRYKATPTPVNISTKDIKGQVLKIQSRARK